MLGCWHYIRRISARGCHNSILALIASGEAKNTQSAIALYRSQVGSCESGSDKNNFGSEPATVSSLPILKLTGVEDNSLIQDSTNSTNQQSPSPQQEWRSCWNCQHRGENIDNQHIYCYCFGALSLIDKSGDERGSECEKWVKREGEYNTAEYLKLAKTFNLNLPIALKPIIEAAAAVEDMTVAAWVTQLICTTLRLDMENLP